MIQLYISILQVDGKFPNIALMKLSAWHKKKGDIVDIYRPLYSKPDRVYMSKVFLSSPDVPEPPNCEIVKGGIGYDLHKTLPDEIEHIYPDYEILNCDYAMGYTSRGCIRKCSFCIVREKEGKAHPVADIYEFWNGQNRLRLLDPNLSALPDHFHRVLDQLIKHNIYTDFSQGLDARLIDDDMAKHLSKVKLWKDIHIAWDRAKDEQSVVKGIKTLTKYIPANKLMCYVLIGYDSTPEEDLYRVETLRSLGVHPFVMPYDKSDSYQRKFARWVNRKQIFLTVPWERYSTGVKNKNFKEKQLNLNLIGGDK